LTASAPPIVVVAAVIERNGDFLLTRRIAGTHLEGLWEFPGGKRHAGESDEAALRRELLEELDVEADVSQKIFEVSHAYPDRTVELRFYRCRLHGIPRPILGQEMQWVARAELGKLSFPPADRELIAMLSQGDL
jgi:8-oxo-dGTP diphosphatase